MEMTPITGRSSPLNKSLSSPHTQEPERALKPDDSAELRWDPFYRTHFTYQQLRNAYQDQYAEEEVMAYWEELGSQDAWFAVKDSDED